MEYFKDVIQGPYPFILVFQVLIISGLLLSLVWLLILRVRATAVVTPQPSAAAPETDSAAHIAHPTVEPPASGAVNVGGGEETKALQEKVKYLESRLLEYEVVQEEISTLGQLRAENEKLKQDILKFQASLGGAASEPTKVTEAATAQASVTEVKPAESAASTASTPSPETASPDQLNAILKGLDDLTASATAAAEAAAAAEPSPAEPPKA